MTTFTTILIEILALSTICNADCVFLDSMGSSLELDLRALAHALIQTQDESGDYNYLYTPCRNGDQCPTESGTDTGMAIQQKEPDECYILSNWDNGDTQPSYDSIENTWSFVYNNGNTCNGSPRQFYVYFHCEMTAGDYTVASAGEVRPCEYEMYINSQWGCPGEVYDPPESTSISGGTVFLILFASVIFLYFVAGWIICAFTNRKDRGFGDIVGNIPHLGFWSQLPSLVCAGCCFTKDFFVGLVSGKSGQAITDEE